MKKALTALVGTALFAFSGAAFAQQQWSGSYSPTMPSRSSGLDNIGEEMQFVFGVDRVMGVAFDRKTITPPSPQKETTYKSTTIALFGMQAAESGMLPRLGLDYFVVESVSVGGSLLYIHQSTSAESDGNSQDGDTTSTFGISPRVGYAMQFDETFSFWPRAGITYVSRSTETPADPANPGSGSTDKFSGLDLTIEGMFGISPFSHFAILVGPYLDLGLSGTHSVEPDTGTAPPDEDAKITSYGLTTSIVGYY